jgi:hypothetical protein
MGKGKGTNSGRRTRVSPGSIVIAFSHLRFGLIYRLLRQMQVRCPLNLQLNSLFSNYTKHPS